MTKPGPPVKDAARAEPAVTDEAPADRYAPGSVLAGKYRLERELGQGGMGTVWAARNLALDADVAIKVIRAGQKAAQLRDRLWREARAVAKLGHPHIVRIFDVGEAANGSPFLVMELLRGVSLNRAIADAEKLNPVAAVQLLLPIADALACAHEAGFVHRDLKPENIFLAHHTTAASTAVRPILLDFGIAISWGGPSHRLTQDGLTIGSPSFMSPEQTRGDESTHRSDLWAFSVVLYEAVTGKLPFSNPNLLRLQQDILEKAAPTFAEQGIAEDALWAIVERGLDKNPLARWRSVRAMGVELARWLVGQGIEADVSNTSLRAAWLKDNRRGGARARAAARAREQAPPSRRRTTHVLASAGTRRRLVIGGAVFLALAGALAAWALRGAGTLPMPPELPRGPVGDGPRPRPTATPPTAVAPAPQPAVAPAPPPAVAPAPASPSPKATTRASGAGPARRSARSTAETPQAGERPAPAPPAPATANPPAAETVEQALDIKTEF